MKPILTSSRLALCVALLSAAPVVHADIYLCRDMHGTLVSTDHLTTDCLTYGGKVIGPNGTVRQHILSAREQAQEEQARKAQQLQARLEREKQREDRALLLRYPNKAALEQARQSDLQRPNALIAEAKKHLQALARQRHQLTLEAQFYPQGPLPLQLRTKFDENRVLTEQENKLIASQTDEIARINQTYDALLARLQPLWQRASSGSSQDGR